MSTKAAVQRLGELRLEVMCVTKPLRGAERTAWPPAWHGGSSVQGKLAAGEALQP
jgi:hypothetical protein